MTDVPLCPDFTARSPPKARTSCLRIFDPAPSDAIPVPTPLSETMQTQESLLLISSNSHYAIIPPLKRMLRGVRHELGYYKT